MHLGEVLLLNNLYTQVSRLFKWFKRQAHGTDLASNLLSAICWLGTSSSLLHSPEPYFSATKWVGRVLIF